MALKKCKECGNNVSTKATSCPTCGAVIKKKFGCFNYIFIVFLIFIIFGVIGSNIDTNTQNSSSKNTQTSVFEKRPQNREKLYKEKETVSVGYTSYAIWRSWWSSNLNDNKFLDERPNAMYLFVELTVRNDDEKPRTVAPFKLIDENGAEYQASSNGWAVDGSLGLIETLNPFVSKQGFVIFDVPKNHKYRLLLSGGYWSSDKAYVQLNPKNSE